MRYVIWTILSLSLLGCSKKNSDPAEALQASRVPSGCIASTTGTHTFQDYGPLSATEYDCPSGGLDKMTCKFYQAATGEREFDCTNIHTLVQAPLTACQFISVPGVGVPLDATGRTSGTYYNVNGVYDCGVATAMRCIFIDYAIGAGETWQDYRCTDDQLP